MTASTVVETRVSGLYANPQTVIARGVHASEHLVIKGTAEVATTSIDDVGDIVLLTELPWNARVDKVIIFNDDMDSHSTPTLAVDVGLYKVTKAGTSTVLSAAAFASAITTLQSANTLGVNVGFEARDINKIAANTVIIDAGLTAEPQDGFAVLGITVTTVAATAAAGTLSFIVEYTM